MFFLIQKFSFFNLKIILQFVQFLKIQKTLQGSFFLKIQRFLPTNTPQFPVPLLPFSFLCPHSNSPFTHILNIIRWYFFGRERRRAQSVNIGHILPIKIKKIKITTYNLQEMPYTHLQLFRTIFQEKEYFTQIHD